MSEHCRVCEEPMSDRYTSEVAHQWHEPGCLNGRVFGEEHTNCDCAGYVHPHCCPCELLTPGLVAYLTDWNPT